MARRFLAAFLAEAGVDDEEVVATAQLCLSELVTNAVVHASTTSELSATLDRVLTVAVRDRGRTGSETRVDRDADPLRVHGRGLLIVEAMADRWGSERDAVGTTVWFALEIDHRGERHAVSDHPQAL